MKQTKFNLAVFMASLCALLVLAASPVMAEDGTSGSGSGGSAGASTGTGGAGSGTTSNGTGGAGSGTTSNGTGSAGTGSDDNNETEVEVEHKVSVFKHDGIETLQNRREGKVHKSKEERAKTCENIQKAVNNKLKAFNTKADKHLARLNALFNKVQTYQTANNLPVSNYDALLATAIQKQSDATLAVQALDSLGTTVDCSSSDPATMLSSVKAGGADARNALKDYRAALKAIVVALVQANKTETTTEDN